MVMEQLNVERAMICQETCAFISRIKKAQVVTHFETKNVHFCEPCITTMPFLHILLTFFFVLVSLSLKYLSHYQWKFSFFFFVLLLKYRGSVHLPPLLTIPNSPRFSSLDTDANLHRIS